MLKLEKVSKFYSANGLVSTGFSKVDIELKMGEFVAITGESGSGKSTLLNVISGLDSYEEGEMLIMNQPTSGFSSEELEEYRKKYIGNIFQNFNLINSYTVFQNVELVLLMSGYDKKDVKGRVDDIIDKVGLSEYSKTKTSKLSGGQKQRVAIARALAKDTPIIVADEPTGNLDSESAQGIIQLLHEISKDKLIIIVTHNYEQVEKYVTRKITMNDGQVAEDKTFKEEYLEEVNAVPAKADALSKKNTVRLGMRNAFNIPAKFGLLLIVFLFLCTAVISMYSSFLNQENMAAEDGYNNYFRNTSNERILVTKPDKSSFTEMDYYKIKKLDNIKDIVVNDLMLDASGNLTDDNDNYYISTKINDLSLYEGNLSGGRMPKNSREGILIFEDDQGYINNIITEILDKKMSLRDDNSGADFLDKKLKIVGYATVTEEEFLELQGDSNYTDAFLYMNEKAMDKIRQSLLERYCTQEIEFADNIFQGNSGVGSYPIVANDKVEDGEVFIPEDIAFAEPNGYVIGKELKITNKSLYFTDEMKFTVKDAYNKNNLNYYLGEKDLEKIAGTIFVSNNDYNKMFDKGNYQSSVMVANPKLAKTTEANLQKAGFETFYIQDGIVSYMEGFDVVFTALRVIMMIGMLLVLFFISYFIIKLILKSRNVYFAIIRMVGATKENCKSLLRVELFVVFTIAFLICIGGIGLMSVGIIDLPSVFAVVSFLHIYDYFILYGILLLISMLISNRFSKQLFKKTAMNAHKEEV
ncbi:MAG: ABC transporter ATP-binding protein/permease [Anaerovoracaceae bacterium]